jgi:ERCC4-type nuclease
MEDVDGNLAWLLETDTDQERVLTRFVVDHREQNSGVLRALDTMKNVDVRVEYLPLGDYLVDDILLFERKTLTDLTISIKDARLFRQAGRLAGDYRHAAFILEGTTHDLRTSLMCREAIQGALITITLGYGLPLLRSLNPAETARLMVYAARQTRAWSTGALPRRARRPKKKQRAQLHMLQGLPGIGPERARRLLATFGSVEAVLTASADELIAVNGIGAATAAAIRWVVSERPARYCINSQIAV